MSFAELKSSSLVLHEIIRKMNSNGKYDFIIKVLVLKWAKILDFVTQKERNRVLPEV